MKELKLEFIEGRLKGRAWKLEPGKTVTIGRGRSNDIVVHHTSISRSHCSFCCEGDTCTVRDLGSRNGVTVNDEKISETAAGPGDIIRIGLETCRITLSDQDGKESTDIEQERTEPDVIRIPAREEYTLHADHTVEDFLRNHGKESAVTVISRFQIVWYAGIVISLFILLNYDWLYFITIINIVIASFYIITIIYRLGTVLVSSVKKSEVAISSHELDAIEDADLPCYTLLVPLYREQEVFAKIISAVEGLDYPHDKLDVKILLESDDEETLAVCRENSLPPCCEVLVVPDVQPKTKPRACNHGLERARGEFLVIYDAEDRPDPDQLKKAFAAFRAHPDIACFQSKLNYYNQNQNFLTKWFTVEYSAWFDLFLPGLHIQNAPIPLGGTSNHFRTELLKKAGGWDPFNVTEDADLGIRLYKEGHRTRVLDSTTWEEANSRLSNWIRQRSRWIKGYIQTHLVHMRHPFHLLFKLGPFGFISFLLTVGGMAFMMLLNPIYWMAALLYCSLAAVDLTQGRSVWEILSSPGVTVLLDGHFRVRDNFHAWRMVFLSSQDSETWSIVSVVFFCVTLVLLSANLIFIIINYIAAKRRKLKKVSLNILLSPLYWILISVAAWKGMIQLFYKPFYWEKTVHGYFKERKRDITQSL